MARPTIAAQFIQAESREAAEPVCATDFARRIADIDARIAEIEFRIVQQQKRVENLLARGADVTELRETIAVLSETSIFLEACKADLEYRRRQEFPET